MPGFASLFKFFVDNPIDLDFEHRTTYGTLSNGGLELFVLVMVMAILASTLTRS